MPGSTVAVGVASMSPKANVPRLAQQGHQADDHAEVADAVDDERLVGRVRGALALDVEADQEVRADADQFPEHEHHRDVAGDHQAQHAEAEQRQILKEAVEAAAAVQVMAVGQRALRGRSRRAARRACSRWRRRGCTMAMSVTMQNMTTVSESM